MYGRISGFPKLLETKASDMRVCALDCWQVKQPLYIYKLSMIHSTPKFYSYLIYSGKARRKKTKDNKLLIGLLPVQYNNTYSTRKYIIIRTT